MQRQKVLLSPEDCREFLEEEKPFKFNLYRIPFNDGQGGKPEPIAGASFNGKSNFFPRYSPDGKWIVFCKAENYMLLQPDSELYIIPAAGGEAAAAAGQHEADELLAQLLAQRQMARLLRQAGWSLHAAVPDPHRRAGREHAAGGLGPSDGPGPGGQHPGIRQRRPLAPFGTFASSSSMMSPMPGPPGNTTGRATMKARNARRERRWS